MADPPGPPSATLSLRSPYRSFQAIPRPIRLLTLGVFINRLGGFFAIFIALILSARGFGSREIASTLALVAVSGIAGSVGGGTVADRIGRRRTIVASTAGAALVTALLATTGGFALTVALACCLAALNQAYGPAAQATVGELAPPDQRVTLFAFYRLALNLGAAAGPVLAGVLMSRSITAMLLVNAAASAGFAVAATRLPRDVASHRQVGEGRRPAGYLAVLRNRAYLPFWAGIGLSALVYAQPTGVLPLAMKDHRLGPEVFGALLSVNALLVILCELPLSTVIRGWRPVLPISLGAALVCAGFAVNWFAISLPVLALGLVGWTVGEMLMAPMSSAVATAIAAPGMQNRYQATLNVTQTLGFSIGPALGVAAYAVHPSLPWLGCAVVGAGVVCAFFFSLRRVPAP